jgi:endonuclease YncB( thermonuclease family)
MKLAAATALAGAIAMPALAQTATDGDTIKINGTTWRLWGIDAPELHQTCGDGWLAGIEAKATLEQFMAAGAIRCEDRGRDRYRRSIGLCRAGGKDLGAAMVSAGMAWAFSPDRHHLARHRNRRRDIVRPLGHQAAALVKHIATPVRLLDIGVHRVGRAPTR